MKTLRTNLNLFASEAPRKLTVKVLSPPGRYWMYNIKEALKRIKFVEAGALVPHEETIEHHVDEMEKKYWERGFVTRVAQTTPLGDGRFMIVDAHHLKRVQTERFGAKVTCVFDNDYSTVPIRTWYPASKLKARDLVLASGAKSEECGLEEGKLLLETGQASFLAVRKRKKKGEVCYALSCTSGLAAEGVSRRVENQHEVISRLDRQGAIDKYVADERLGEYLDREYTLLVRQPFTHAQVLEHVSKGGLFPPKSTRHIFSIEIRIPLPGEMFYLSADEANQVLQNVQFSSFVFVNWQGL